MADVDEEVVAACCTLVLAAGLGAATVLNKRKNESTQHGLNHISDSGSRPDIYDINANNNGKRFTTEMT